MRSDMRSDNAVPAYQGLSVAKSLPRRQAGRKAGNKLICEASEAKSLSDRTGATIAKSLD